MKLKKIIKYLDYGCDIKIWAADTPYDDFSVVYEGSMWNIPEEYKEYKLILAEDNELSEAIFPFMKKLDNGVEINTFRVTVIKNY